MPSPNAIEGSILLVSTGIGEDEVRAWAERSGFRVVVLPVPGHRARPDADPAERRRLGRQEASELAAVLRRVRDARPSEVAAVLVSEADVAGQAGRAWLRRLTEAADRVRVALPRPVRFGADAAFDESRLERRILADAD